MRGHSTISKTKLSLTALASVFMLSACSDSEIGLWRSDAEAGMLLNGQDFGNATMNNTLVLTGERAYTFDLANRFAAETITQVHFAFNSARLDAGARDALREQARWIKHFPEVTFRVFGHADAPGSNAYNRALGLRRARTVVNYLTSQGISRSRLEAVSSLGETQPLVQTQGRERRNRRAVTEVSGFVKGHPSTLDGKYAQVVYREYVESATGQTKLTGLEGSDFSTEK